MIKLETYNLQAGSYNMQQTTAIKVKSCKKWATPPCRGVARNLFRRRTNLGSGGWKSLSGVQGWSPDGGLGA